MNKTYFLLCLLFFFLYLEAYNNQKQSEISNRKSLFISVF